jgi:hypothetical protein
MLVLRTSTPFTNTDLPLLVRDELLGEANGGVLFLADALSPFSWPSQGAPVTADAVRDISETGNGAWSITSGQTVSFNDGWDFSALTSKVAEILIPAAVSADLFADQEFIVCAYLVLPIKTDWNQESVLAPIFCFSPTTGGYTTSADLVTVGFRWVTGDSTRRIMAFRQTDGSTTGDFLFAPASATIPDAHFGQFAQVAVYRDGTNFVLILRTSVGTISSSVSAPSLNSGDFSANQGRFGVVNPFWNLGLATHLTCSNHKLCRFFVENLATSGRDAASVLDADWTRTAARFA